MSDSPKPIDARKAVALMMAFSGLGSGVRYWAPWKPRPFVGAKAARPKVRQGATAKPPLGAEHAAAVASMREARRGKRIAKAQRALAHKRRRQAAQLRRHLLAEHQHSTGRAVRAPHFVLY